KAYKSKQNKIRLKLGNKYEDFGLVLCQDNGKPLDPSSFSEHYKGILKNAGLPDVCFHSLRHTFATLSLEAGVSIKAIQDILGHSTISTTMDTYSHVTKKMKKDAADIISSVVITNEQKNMSL
ncbi:MAG: tyrosine-type recombinase/integrase, partial [Halanaerobiales bacterium]